MSEPFDLERAPLSRMAIIEQKESFYLHMAFHHAILDGWSEAIFFVELIQVYLALLANEVVELP